MVFDHLPKVRTIKYIKQVLANYDGRYLKLKLNDGASYHFVSVNCDEWFFNTTEDLFGWATFYFWNRDMQPAGGIK